MTSSLADLALQVAPKALEAQVLSLQTTLGRMELALGVLSEGIAWTDADGTVLWCNGAFARLAGRPALGAVGMPVEQALRLTRAGAEIGHDQHPVKRALAGDRTGGRAVVEAFQTRRGDQDRYLEVYASALVSRSGTSALMVVRDNTERHLAEQWLEAESRRAELVRAVAAASNQAEDPELALETGLKLVCAFLGWPIGRAVLVDPGVGSEDDESGELWHRENSVDFTEFVEGRSGGDGAARLAGLPERVLGSASVEWIADLNDCPGCERAAAAARAGLNSALAFPVRSLRETRAVLEFFTPRRTAPDPELMPMFEQIGAQLGRVFERQQSRQGLVQSKLELEQRVTERTKELTALNASLESEILSRERFQAALRESMDRYHSLMQSVRDVIFGISAQGRVESLNSAFDALTGLRRKDQVMERVIPFIHKEDRRLAATAFRQALEGKQVAPFEVRIRHSSVEWIFVECSLMLQTKAGHSPSVAGIARDVTESRRSKSELVVRDRAMAATSEGIVITDPRQPGNPITFLNTGFERLTGYAPADAMGKSLESVLRGPDTSEDALKKLAATVAKCEALTVEMQAHHRDGKPFWIRLVVTPVLDEQQRPANLVAIISDISPQKEAERMKNEFVSTVSHELRTPLTSLRGFAELMLERDYPPEKQKKFIQIIHRESTRLGNLINDFLDVQRMESGRQDYRFARVPLGHVINDTASLFRPTSARHQFEVDCPDDLPEVRADVDRLRQITTNLLSNAVKFSPKGGLVKVSAHRDGPVVEVSVSDQGIGIPADAIGNLFGKFYRVDNTETRKIGGTGLGLSIVKQIVDAHGGRIWVESELGKGTSIIFNLPVFS